MKNKKYSFSTMLTTVILAVALAISVTMMLSMRYFSRQVNAVGQKQALYNHINDIDTKVRSHYGTIDEEILRRGIAAGYVSGLQDPYAKFYDTAAYKQALLERSGQSAGVGITLRAVGSTVMVEAVDVGSAAEKAGVKVGDIVTALGGNPLTSSMISTAQQTLDTSTEKLSLSVQRAGKAMAFELTAYTYQLKSVTERMLNDTVGYIRITGFYDNTASQFKAAHSALQNEGATAFVYDLRSCSKGGSYQALQEMLSFVMPHGVYATFVRGDGTVENLVAHAANSVSGTATVLANANTRGEAELFAGILQEFKIATVVGQATAGKGKVQDFVPLQSDNSAMLLTVGEITLIQGGSIEGVGVKPSVEVFMDAQKVTQIGSLNDADDTQLQAALQTFNTNVSAQTVTPTTAAPTTAPTNP